jgi:hypothetical protein
MNINFYFSGGNMKIACKRYIGNEKSVEPDEEKGLFGLKSY